MKNKIINLMILTIVLSVTSYIIIFVSGKTYTLKFRLTDESYKEVTIENYTGEIEVIDEKNINKDFLVKVKAKKEGKAYVNLNYKSYQECKVLYIHKNMVITENTFFGKSFLDLSIKYSPYYVNRKTDFPLENQYFFRINLLAKSMA